MSLVTGLAGSKTPDYYSLFFFIHVRMSLELGPKTPVLY